MAKNRSQWAKDLADMIRIWCEENRYLKYTQLRDELKIPDRQWQQLMIGDFIATEYYALIYERTGLTEADPRTVPPKPQYNMRSKSFTDKPRAWTNEEYNVWKSQPVKMPVETKTSMSASGKEIPAVTDKYQPPKYGDKMSEATRIKNTWAHTLADKIRKWCESNGYKNYIILGHELEIPLVQWKQIMAGDFVKTEFYARIFARTGIPETDPRTIPPRLYKYPGGSTQKARAWSEEEFNSWKLSRLSQLASSSSPLRGSFQIPGMAEKTDSSVKQPSMPEFGQNRAEQLTLGSLFDEVINGLINDLKIFIKEEMRPVIEETVAKALWESKVRQTPVRETPTSSSAESRNVNTLSRNLLSALLEQMNGTKQQRTEFAKQYGRVLTNLFPYIEGFTLTDESKREEHLNSIQTIEVEKL